MSYYNSYWGGAREGAGRPKKEPTKVFRLTEKEIELIKVLRSKSDDINIDLVIEHAKSAENNMAYF